jgi:phospholipid/cholesterol/gamma-HCH transport system substrate-binding protein
METRASYVLVGAFVLALMLAAFGFVIYLARGQFEEGGNVYQVDFAGAVTGLEVGSRVRYRGVPVGSVTSIRLDPQNVANIQVLLSVEPRTPIKEDTIASLGLQGITGVAYIALSGGTQASPLLKARPGQRYPVIAARASGLEKILEDLPKLSERAVELIDRVSRVLDERNARAISDTLANVSSLTGDLAKRTADIDRMFAQATDTVEALHRTANTLDGLAKRIDKEVGPLGGEARRTLETVRSTARTLGATADTLRDVVQENRRPLKDFSANGLYEMSQFMTEARVLVANFNQLILQIQRDPARFFFGDTQKGYEAK